MKKKKILSILLFGKKAKKMNLPGIVHGEREGQVGILNARLWL